MAGARSYLATCRITKEIIEKIKWIICSASNGVLTTAYDFNPGQFQLILLGKTRLVAVGYYGIIMKGRNARSWHTATRGERPSYWDGYLNCAGNGPSRLRACFCSILWTVMVIRIGKQIFCKHAQLLILKFHFRRFKNFIRNVHSHSFLGLPFWLYHCVFNGQIQKWGNGHFKACFSRVGTGLLRVIGIMFRAIAYFWAMVLNASVHCWPSWFYRLRNWQPDEYGEIYLDTFPSPSSYLRLTFWIRGNFRDGIDISPHVTQRFSKFD